MKIGVAAAIVLALFAPPLSAGEDLAQAVARDYERSLADLFVWFHSHPELSFREYETAARLAEELRRAGVEVTEGVGGTGVVGMLRNGDGPLVMVRADMDGLPLRSVRSAVRGHLSIMRQFVKHDSHFRKGRVDCLLNGDGAQTRRPANSPAERTKMQVLSPSASSMMRSA
jgi:hypothetical protein